MDAIKQLVTLLRLSHWSKSAFVLLGVVYSGSLDKGWEALIAAFAFCFTSSAVYIYNDLQDREEDRLHPNKCQRPLATGEVSLVFALVTLGCLLILGLLIAYFISSALTAILGVYLLVNMLYNHGLKNIPICDVLCIASGFMLRVLAGTLGIGLPISWWLTSSATLISLYIALCKRRLEKQLSGRKETRKVLKKYSNRHLDFLIAITAGTTFIVYLMYVIWVQEEAFAFLLTIPFAAIGLWRFSRLTIKNGKVDDPVTLFFGDYLSRLNLLCFLALTLLALFK